MAFVSKSWLVQSSQRSFDHDCDDVDLLVVPASKRGPENQTAMMCAQLQRNYVLENGMDYSYLALYLTERDIVSLVRGIAENSSKKLLGKLRDALQCNDASGNG